MISEFGFRNGEKEAISNPQSEISNPKSAKVGYAFVKTLKTPRLYRLYLPIRRKVG